MAFITRYDSHKILRSRSLDVAKVLRPDDISDKVDHVTSSNAKLKTGSFEMLARPHTTCFLCGDSLRTHSKLIYIGGDIDKPTENDDEHQSTAVKDQIAVQVWLHPECAFKLARYLINDYHEFLER